MIEPVHRRWISLFLESVCVLHSMRISKSDSTPTVNRATNTRDRLSLKVSCFSVLYLISSLISFSLINETRRVTC